MQEESRGSVTQDHSIMAGICRLTFSIYLINYYCIRYDFLTSRVLFEPGLYHAVSHFANFTLILPPPSSLMLLEIQLSFSSFFFFHSRTLGFTHTHTHLQTKRFIFSVFMTLIAAFAFQILISAPLEDLRKKYFCPLIQTSRPADRDCGDNKIK